MTGLFGWTSVEIETVWWVVYGRFSERLFIISANQPIAIGEKIQDSLFSWPRVSFRHGPDDDGCHSHLCGRQNNVRGEPRIELLPRVVCKL